MGTKNIAKKHSMKHDPRLPLFSQDKAIRQQATKGQQMASV